MRIRKHAKLAGLTVVNASGSADLSPLTRICHLNQSPWDVLSFAPDSASSPFQVVDVGEDSFTANGSLGDSVGAVESVASMKLSVDGEEKNVKKYAMKPAEIVEKREEFGTSNGIILCCKTDGKGWQCKKEASRGNSLCQHHLVQIRTYNSLASIGVKKFDKPTATAAADDGKTVMIRRCPRPNKKVSSSTSNPHEFYYYSGFGPRWGKKRGTRVEPSDTNKAKCNEIDKVVKQATPSSSSQIDDEEIDFIEDYDDDDDNEEESGELGRKRIRKPIKARSLKSLM